jgi:hypothetical protein
VKGSDSVIKLLCEIRGINRLVIAR